MSPAGAQTRAQKQGIESRLGALPIPGKSKGAPRTAAPADSWEDEDVASMSTDSDSLDSQRSSPQNKSSVPDAPPPTPSSPSMRSGASWGIFPSISSASSPGSPGASPSQLRASRPEKSAAAAGRMIAGALGVKAPQSTEEGKAYERAIREKEAKRLRNEKEERKAEDKRQEQARRAIWED